MNPSAWQASEAIASRLALIGLCLAALLAGIHWYGFLAAMALVVVASLVDLRASWHRLHRAPLFWLSLALTVYILVQTPFAVREFPELARNSYPDWTHLLAISGLLSVIAGDWLRRFPSLYPRLLALTGIGIAIGLAAGIQWGNLLDSGMGVRRDWGYLPEEVGLLSSMGFLACVVLFLRCLGNGSHPHPRRVLHALPWFLAALAFAVVLYGSQTRATWIAASVLALLYVTWHLGNALRQRQSLRSGIAAVCVLVIGITALVQLDGGERLERRLGGVQDTVTALLILDREGVHRSNPSLGERLNMWTEAVRAFTQRPIRGWGIGAKVVTDSQAQLFVGWRQPQYHNLYLEFLLGLGLIGLGLFLAIWALLVRPLIPLPAAVRKAATDAGPPPPSRTILALCTALTAFAVMFELQVGNPSSRAMVMWLMALLAGLALSSRTEPPDHAPESEPAKEG